VPKRPYHHGHLKKALIESSLALIDERGVAGLTLRQAARRAGVSHAAPAHHFGNLEGLLAAVAEQGFAQLAEALSAASATESDALRAFRAMGRAYVGFALEMPARFRVMYHAKLADKSCYPELAAAADRAIGLLVQAIEACQRAAQIRSGDAQALALFVLSSCHGFSSLAINGQLGEPTQDAGELSALIEQLLDAIHLGNATRDSHRPAAPRTGPR
jgi:AcrR family transcriptional regulator